MGIGSCRLLALAITHYNMVLGGVVVMVALYNRVSTADKEQNPETQRLPVPRTAPNKPGQRGVMKRCATLLCVTFAWWLMSEWAYSDNERILAGPFPTPNQCEDAGTHLPWQLANSGWHCEQD